MKTVLFVKPPKRSGSLYFRTEQYISFFKKNNWKIRIFYPAPDGSTFCEKLSARQIFTKALFTLTQFPKFLLDLISADLVFLHPSPMFFLYTALVKIFGKRIVIDHIVSYVSHRDIFLQFPIWLDRYVYVLSNFVLTHTETMKILLIERFDIPASKILVAYCDIDLQHFSPRYNAEAARMKEELGIEGKKIVFYHGMRHEWHAVDLLLKAAQIVEKERKDVLFVFMPAFPAHIQTGKNVINLDAERHYSWRTLPIYIQMCDIWASGFRIMDRGERSMGSTLIQALAMAKPVITAQGHEKNKFLKDRHNVFFVKPNSAEAIAGKILECLDHPDELQAVGHEARVTAEMNFSIEKLEQVLDQLIERR